MAFSISNNTPSIGYVQWADVNIQYKGVSYAVTNGYTNYRYVYWLAANPSQFFVSDTFPTLTPDDALVFMNKNGVALIVPTATIIDGGLVVPGSIYADALAANTITGDKIIAGAITADKIAANAIGADKIAAAAITSDKIAASGIDAGKITTGVLNATRVQIGSGSTFAEGYDPTTKETPSAAQEKADAAYESAKDYIQSRGENLVTNGTGLLGDNTNFTSFVFDGADNYACNGSFKHVSTQTAKAISEKIPVNPDLSYRFNYYVKANPYIAGGKGYGYLSCFDADNLGIGPNHTMYISNTLTTLAQELKAGDTVVYLASTANWRNTEGSATYRRSFIFWNYTNSFGYTYPELTYSRYYYSNAWQDGGVDYVNNTITLTSPWAGATFSAGTKVSNGNSGGSYKYIAGSYYEYSSSWTNYNGLISGIDTTGTNITNKFHPGTASISIGWLINYGTTGSTVWISNVSFGIDVETVSGSTAKVAVAQAAADAAQSTANTASTNATSALSQLTDITADNKIVAVEKQLLKKEWDAISAEKSVIDTQADAFGVTTEKTTYGSKYTALNTYINTTYPLFSSLTTTTTIDDGATLRLKFKEYYDARTALLNKISTVAKALADAAQGTANTALANAATAQTTANGKNKVFYQTEAPTASAVGDTWFDTDNGNKAYKWDGSSWVASLFGTGAIADASITTAKIGALQVTEALIADAAISNAKIASLNAGKVTAGKLQSSDTKTYFDLDNSEIRGEKSEEIIEILNSIVLTQGTLSTTTGLWSDNTSYGVTGYYGVIPSSSVTIAGTVYTCYKFFYNSAKQFISYSSSNPATVPSTARYIRLRFYNAGAAFTSWVNNVSGTMTLTAPIIFVINPTVGPRFTKGDLKILSIEKGSICANDRMLINRFLPKNSTEISIRNFKPGGIIFDENYDGTFTPYAYIDVKDYEDILGVAYPRMMIRSVGATGYGDIDIIAGGELKLGAPLVSHTPTITTATLQNSWANYSAADGTYNQAGYYRFGGRVYLQGLIKSGSTGTTAFTLNSDFRPPKQLLFPILVYGNNLGYLQIETDGEVKPIVPNSTWLSLEGISFAL